MYKYIDGQTSKPFHFACKLNFEHKKGKKMPRLNMQFQAFFFLFLSFEIYLYASISILD